MGTKNVIVKQVENAEVPVEVLASSITAISEGTKRLLSGPLTDDCIVLLIKNAIPSNSQGRVGKREIVQVLAAMESLESLYVKKASRVAG